MNELIPLFVKDGFIICFTAEPETDIPMRTHFVKECGWTEEAFRGLRGMQWFSAKVSAWKDGRELSAVYLGCCCYKTIAEFYTTYNCDGGYFPQMVNEAIGDAKARLECEAAKVGPPVAVPPVPGQVVGDTPCPAAVTCEYD